MIGYLKGKIIYKELRKAILDVNGVGYQFEAVAFEVIEGEEVEVFVHTHFRENDLTLFGFKERLSLTIFEYLITVNGIGPKTASVILSEVGTEKIISSILNNDHKSLRTKGVGSKTAQRLVLELKDKMKGFEYLLKETKNTKQKQNTDEAIEALQNLGYQKNEVLAAIENLEIDAGLDTQGLIKQILRAL